MRSMTGYGSAEGKVGKGAVFVEIRTVNHRYCDLQVKIPAKMGVLDPKLRKALQENIDRGKVEFFLKEKAGIEPSAHLVINEPLLRQYDATLKKVAKLLGQKTSVDLLSVVDLKELLIVREVNVSYEKLWSQIKKVVDAALARLNKMRVTEGRFLFQDQTKRVLKLHSLVKQIQAQSEHTITRYKERTRSRLGKEIGRASIDENRLQADVSSLADRIDIAEEITRLQSHLVQYKTSLKSKGSIGRQLDFLLQEMNREINTIGSKALDADVSKYVVEAKSELEKLREQAQNIE